MANETMRIFFPLKIFSYPQYDCSEDEREDISSRDAVAYEDQILAAIAKENRHFENDRGLAEYIHDEALKEKVHSLYPTVEVVDGELWGVMTAGLKETLTGEETAALMDYVCGQNSDGYGDTATAGAKDLNSVPSKRRMEKSMSAFGTAKITP